MPLRPPPAANANESAPRSGARTLANRTAERCGDISQGYAFFAYPWREYAISDRTLKGCEESSAPLQGAVLGLRHSRWYALQNALYHRLISSHASGVHQLPTVRPFSSSISLCNLAPRGRLLLANEELKLAGCKLTSSPARGEDTGKDTRIHCDCGANSCIRHRGQYRCLLRDQCGSPQTAPISRRRPAHADHSAQLSQWEHVCRAGAPPRLGPDELIISSHHRLLHPGQR